MKRILIIVALLFTKHAFASASDAEAIKSIESIKACEYSGDVNKVLSFVVEDWKSSAKESGYSFDRRVRVYPLSTINGLFFERGAIIYGEKMDISTPLKFYTEPETGKRSAWFYSSAEAIEKITITLWYGGEGMCLMRIRVPLKDNIEIKAPPSKSYYKIIGLKHNKLLKRTAQTCAASHGCAGLAVARFALHSAA